MLRFCFMTFLAAAGLSGALAQPLTSLVPAEAFLTLGATWQGNPFESLDDDLAALDWNRGKATLERIARSLSQTADPEFEMMLSSLTDPDEAMASFLDFCPEYEQAVDALEAFETRYGRMPGSEALLSVSMSPFNPLPSVLALLRVELGSEAIYRTASEVLLSCIERSGSSEVIRLDQGGVTLYVIGDGGDFPVVAGMVDNVMFFGTDPEAARGVVRRLQGSEEPSFADSHVAQRAAQSLRPGDFSLSVDFKAIAETGSNLLGFLVYDGDPLTSYLVERSAAALATLGGYAGTVRITDAGLELESILAVNPEGGDIALAEAILCRSCAVRRPALAPRDSISVASERLDITAFTAYVDTWLRDLGELSPEGQAMDLRTLLKEEFDFDLDRALLDWIGGEVHTVGLEAFGSSLSSIFVDPEVAFIIPVSSADAARTGLAEWGRALAPYLGMIGQGLDPYNASDFFDAPLPEAFVQDSYLYQGVDIGRLRAGFTTDYGLALVGNSLVIGSPTRTIEKIVDTYQGAPNILSNRSYVEATSASVYPRLALGYSDNAKSLAAAADFFEVFVQPLAFLALIGLDSLEEQSSLFLDDYGVIEYGIDDYLPAELPPFIEAISGQDGVTLDRLSEEDENAYGGISKLYELNDLTVGERVTVTLESQDFDTYLFLIDAEAERYLLENDDAPDVTRSEFSFVVEAGLSYVVEVTSFEEYEMGAYSLSVQSSPTDIGQVSSVAPPTFGDMLHLIGLFPATLEVLSEHLGVTRSHLTVEGDNLKQTISTRIRW